MGQIAHHTLADTTADHRTEMPDVEKIRRDFPILNTIVYGHPLIYFDNAATMQKPKSVIEAISNYYLTQNANIHRGIHYLSEQATAGYEATRTKVRDFIHAQSENEIIFTGGTTDAINLVAMSFERMSLNANDEIIVSNMEHHSNIVPWQILCDARLHRARFLSTRRSDIKFRQRSLRNQNRRSTFPGRCSKDRRNNHNPHRQYENDYRRNPVFDP